MDVAKTCAIGLGVILAGQGGRAAAEAAEAVQLRETDPTGTTTRARIVLKAVGRYLPAPLPGASAEKSPRPLALRVETQLEFLEKVVARDAGGRAGRAVRRVVRAGSAINGEIRPSAATVRPAVALLVAVSRPEGVVVFSPLGPLTRSELEVLQGPGDPLAFDGLLPGRPVEVGQRWKVGEAAVKALSAYDTLTETTMEATLESADAAAALVRLRGEVRGSVLGGEGSMACDGSFTFDRKAGRISRLTLDRTEARRPGPVEGGLDVKSTLTVTREAAETPRELADETLAKLSLEPGPDREQLLFEAPGGKYSLRHDRDWHIFWDDPRQSVLKRVERGTAVAQCNLVTGPTAGKGRHQDPSQFRDDVRKGLGPRFVQFLGAGEVEGDPAGGYRYKVGVQGREGDLGIVWYYYLIASPDGDQLLATFTLSEAQARAFGDRDEALIGSLRWRDAGPGGK